ncbi:MAG: PAS domain S-box protein [Sterolibacterium sp.]|nr:PAS domain S-box protein [Sterolibacterium sp.]
MERRMRRLEAFTYPDDREEAQRMLHEAEAHQMELKRQNEDLRQAQMELDALRAHYFALYDLAPVGYFTLSEPGLVLEANHTAATLLGVAWGELIKQPISRFIFDEDQGIHHRRHMQLIQTGAQQSGELRMVRNDGTLFWVHQVFSYAQDENGVPICHIVLSDITMRKRAEEQLFEMANTLEEQVNLRTNRLRAVSSQLTMTEERERRLLAQELHDNLCQILAVIKIKLTSLAAGALQPSVDQIVELVNRADQSARMITRELSPPILRTLGLIPALECMAKDKMHSFDLGVHFDSVGEPKPLEEWVQAVLYRSVRELLINVAKHAKASEATLLCRSEESRLTLVVCDDGCGFDSVNDQNVLSEQNGFGLSSIYERLTNIGGEMEIDSSPGHGATITLTVPYSTAAKATPPS